MTLPDSYTVAQRGVNGAYSFYWQGQRYGCFATRDAAERAAHDHHEAEQSVFPQARRWANEIEHNL